MHALMIPQIRYKSRKYTFIGSRSVRIQVCGYFASILLLFLQQTREVFDVPVCLFFHLYLLCSL